MQPARVFFFKNLGEIFDDSGKGVQFEEFFQFINQFIYCS